MALLTIEEFYGQRYANCLTEEDYLQADYNAAAIGFRASGLETDRDGFPVPTSAADFETFINQLSHERTLDYFDRYAHILDEETYWSQLAATIQRQKVLSGRSFDLLSLLCGCSNEPPRRDISCRDTMMSKQERQVRDALPEQVEIYRGFNRGEQDGLCWSLRRGVAEWFANWMMPADSKQRRLVTATVRKNDIVALLTSRNEDTVIIEDASQLKDVTVSVLSGPIVDRR